MAFAKVDRSLRGKISADARRKRCSVSRFIFFLVESRRTPPIVHTDEPASSGLVRMYVQLPHSLASTLRAEAAKIGMKLPLYLGFIAHAHYNGRARAGA